MQQDVGDEKIQNLLKIMPETPPKMWPLSDFQKFLEFIELEDLKNLFRIDFFYPHDKISLF